MVREMFRSKHAEGAKTSGASPWGMGCASALIVSISVALGLASPARAAMMEHHDLTSLALVSDVIVRAERVGGTSDVPVYRVLHVLGGSGLAMGATVTISQSGHSVSGASGGTVLSSLDPVAVLFLVRRSGVWYLAPSGLRLFSGGRAYRFEQWSNPGPYAAVPQGRDPEDARGIDTGVHLDLAQLEAAIGAAVSRAGQVRSALALQSPPARRAALLALVGPRRDLRVPDLGLDSGSAGFYEDLVAAHAFDALAAAGDLDGALDIYARTIGLRGHRAARLPEPALLAVATATSSPPERRVAALELLPSIPSDTTVAQLVALARADASGSVRAEALDRLALIGGLTTSDPTLAARQRRIGVDVNALLRERVAVETAARVRFAIFACAAQWQTALRVASDQRVAVVAVRDGDRVRWAASVAPGTQPTMRSARALRADGTDCGADPDRSSTTGLEWAGETRVAGCAASSFVISFGAYVGRSPL